MLKGGTTREVTRAAPKDIASDSNIFDFALCASFKIRRAGSDVETILLGHKRG
jgi:hypothetical protein